MFSGTYAIIKISEVRIYVSIEYFIYYLIFVSIVFMSLFMLTYDSGNIILLLSCVVIVYGLFWMENFFIKGKMKLKIIAEVTN